MKTPRFQLRKKPISQSARPWLLGGVGLAALGSLFYGLASLGPKRVAPPSSVVTSADDSEVTRWSAEIEALERVYRQGAQAPVPNPEARAALERAIEKQKELLRTFAKAGLDQSSRLTRLETERADIQAREIAPEIERLQLEGEKLLSAGKAAESETQLREALRLQKEINVSPASSRHKNYVRETALTQALAAVEAAPLRQAKEEALLAARQATHEQRWADALTAYTAARDSQARINREYGRTRYADLFEADRLSAEIESLNAAGIAAEIQSKAQAGDAAMAAERATEAAALYSAAGALQLKINQNYPRSRFVSAQLTESLEVKRQTALSFDLAASISHLNRSISVHLSRRQVEAADQQLTLIGAKLEQLAADFPKSTWVDDELRRKIGYLALRRENLRSIQDAVFDQLRPLPGATGPRMLARELPQALYVLVMNTNPSRNSGPALPVDSVSWNDAQDFCLRLSWLLGRPIRLPSKEEFRLALGESARVGWDNKNSGGRSHEADREKNNSLGFSDLLGNLAEWTAAGTATDQAGVFGGSYLDTPETLAKMPVELRPKSDRGRHIGLRILME